MIDDVDLCGHGLAFYRHNSVGAGSTALVFPPSGVKPPPTSIDDTLNFFGPIVNVEQIHLGQKTVPSLTMRIGGSPPRNSVASERPAAQVPPSPLRLARDGVVPITGPLAAAGVGGQSNVAQCVGSAMVRISFPDDGICIQLSAEMSSVVGLDVVYLLSRVLTK